MVKKSRESHTAPPPSAETDSESSSDSSQGEDLQSTPPPPSAAADKKRATQKKPVEPVAEKATDSDSDSDNSDSPVKPKPMDDSSKLGKPRSKTNYKPSNPAASPSNTPAKRAPAEEEEQKDLKKPKKEKREGGGAEEKKSTLFQRLWSDDDEIVILKGILEYKEKKGADPMADANDFHDFIKNSLHVNVDRSQMVSKVRRLKKRYVNSAAKRKTFNAHERNAIELSKKIWGDNGGQSPNNAADRQTKSTAAARKSVGSTGRTSKVAIKGSMDGGIAGSSQEEGGNSWQFIGKASISMGLDENIVKIGLGLCEEDKKAEIEEQWKQLNLVENDLWLRKLDLAREESKMVIEALKK